MTDAESQGPIGVLGATSIVGKCLLPLLTERGWEVTAFSRQAITQLNVGVRWQRLNPSHSSSSYLAVKDENIPLWVCAAPIWILPNYFWLLEAHRAKRVVVISSTSRFTKQGSTDPEEQAIAHRLIEAEACVRSWAESRGVEWVILRPTLIYGFGKDKNLAEIARFIRRFNFFPLFGKATGLRQPIHAQDVADACYSALLKPNAANREYNLSGGETLTYREMVTRVFVALSCRPRMVAAPLWLFRIIIRVLRCTRRYRNWSVAMAERMNEDLVFDHTDAARDLNFAPRPFQLSVKDVLQEKL